MNQLRRLLKQAKISSAQLSEALNMPFRTITYQYTSGRIPYALVYKIHLVTGIPMEELVPKFLAENWLYLMEKQVGLRQPMGKKKIWTPADNQQQETVAPTPQTVAPKQTPAALPNSLSPEPPAEEVATKKPASAPIYKVPPQIRGRTSVADIMKGSPPPPPEPSEPDPDFSNVDDSVFQTSADQNAAKRKR